MTTSTLPGVLTYLAGDGKGSKVGGVWPGTPTFIAEPTQGQAADFIAVSWAGPEASGASGLQRLTNAAASTSQETYDVILQLVAWQGTTDVMACIVRVFALFDTLWNALAANPTLDDLVSLAQITDWALPLDQTGKGALVTLSVTVSVTAFRA